MATFFSDMATTTDTTIFTRTMPYELQQIEKGTAIIYMTIPEFRNLGEDIRDFLNILGFKQSASTIVASSKLLQGTAEIFKDDTVVYVAQVPKVNLYKMEFTFNRLGVLIDIRLKDVNMKRQALDPIMEYPYVAL